MLLDSPLLYFAAVLASEAPIRFSKLFS